MWKQTKDKTLLCFARHILWMYAWCVLIGSERKKEKRKEQDVFKTGSVIVENRTATKFSEEGKNKEKKINIVCCICVFSCFLVICLPLKISSCVMPDGAVMCQLHSEQPFYVALGRVLIWCSDFDQLMLQTVTGYQLKMSEYIFRGIICIAWPSCYYVLDLLCVKEDNVHQTNSIILNVRIYNQQ